jgi:CHAD domain-containing protein
MEERETKLEVAPEFTLPELANGDGGVVAKPGSEQRLRTTYYDTPDMRLARWGCNLRYRRGEGWTVKLPSGKDGPLLVRDEHVFKGRASRPPKDAVELLRAYVRDAELEPVATLRTRRRPVELLDRSGQRLGELADDQVEVLDGRQVMRRFRQIELELAPEAPDDALDGAVERLRGAGAEPAKVGSKYLRALGDQDLVAPEVVLSEPGPDTSAVELLRHDLGAAVLRLFRHEPGVRLGEDPEAVHKARVATRRLRSSLRSFQAVLEPGWTARLRAETKRLSDRLGAVRDADVLLARLERHAGELEEPDAQGVERLLKPLHGERDAARSRLLAAMGEGRYTRLLEDLLSAASAPAVLDPGQPAAEALVPLVAKTWRKLRKEVGRAGNHPSDGSDAHLHKIRIRAKRCRYAAEAVVPLVGKPAAQFAAAVEEVQELLGEHHDAVVAEAWLRQASGGIGVGKRKKARVAGQLIAMERADAERLRARWPATWDQLDRKKLRAWLS